MSHLLSYRKEYFKRTDDSSTDMNLDFTGSGVGTKTFRITGPSSGIWYGEKIQLMIQDGTGWHSARFAGLSAALTTGMILRHRTLPSTDIWSWTIKRNNALIEKLDLKQVHDFTNNETCAVFELEAVNGTAFHVTSSDVLEIVLADDLSALTRMRAHLIYGVK